MTGSELKHILGGEVMKPLGPVPCVEGVLSGRRPDDTEGF